MRDKLTAEFFGTAFLVMAITGAGQMAATLSSGDSFSILLAVSAAAGAALSVMIIAFGPLSGAHFNPAVTVAMLMRRKIGGQEALPYVASQILGGVVGVIVANVMFSLPAISLATTERSGPPLWVGEFVATFGLVLAILVAARHAPKLIPFVVGPYIFAAHWFTSSTSFANPAVTIARMFSDSPTGIEPASAPAFIVAQLLAAMLAASVGALIAADE